jgi:hypothetical protein
MIETVIYRNFFNCMSFCIQIVLNGFDAIIVKCQYKFKKFSFLFCFIIFLYLPNCLKTGCFKVQKNFFTTVSEVKVCALRTSNLP